MPSDGPPDLPPDQPIATTPAASGDQVPTSGSPPPTFPGGQPQLVPGGSNPPVAQPDVVDVYRQATASMRDATKWVMAFVPAATVVFALIGLIPKLSDVRAGSEARSHAILWISLGVVASVIALVAAVPVLTAGPAGWGPLMVAISEDLHSAGVGGPSQRTLAAELNSEGFLALYGYWSTAEFFAALDNQDPAALSVAVVAGSTAMDFAAFRTVRGRFKTFVILGGIALIGSVGSLISASVTIADAPSAPVQVATPLEVKLNPIATGRIAINKAAGCQTRGNVDAWAVAGDVVSPLLIIDARGAGCHPATLDWNPAWGPPVPVRTDSSTHTKSSEPCKTRLWKRYHSSCGIHVH